MIEELVLSKLSHGKVVLWTLGDSCIHSGRQTHEAKSLLAYH
jgi:hypothetical protein